MSFIWFFKSYFIDIEIEMELKETQDDDNKKQGTTYVYFYTQLKTSQFWVIAKTINRPHSTIG